MNPPQSYLALQSRRQFFRQSGLTLGTAALTTLLRQQLGAAPVAANPLAAHPPHFAPKAKSVIYLHMIGAPSQLDLFEEKPELVQRVLRVYEEARKFSLANYDEVKKVFIAVTKLPDAVVDKQLKERTELTHSRIGAPQRESILAAGIALQQAGVIDAKVDVKATLDSLIDDQVPLPTN